LGWNSRGGLDVDTESPSRTFVRHSPAKMFPEVP
jgi:hypothetical protein